MRRRKNKKFVSIITFILAATMLLSVFTVFLIKTNRYNKPTPTIYPESGFMVGKNINWTAVLASDPTGLNKIQREWKGARQVYEEEGLYSVSVRIRVDGGQWSDWLEHEFYVHPNKRVVQVATGETHTLILYEDGTVRAFGNNKYGQLGDGTNKSSAVPVEVEGLENVKAVYAGFRHSYALLEDGTLMAWGFNEMGQLGDGTTEDRNVPVRIDLDNVVQLDTLGQHAIVIDGDGKVYVWGWNKDGRIIPSVEDEHVLTPTLVEGLTDVKQVACGYKHFAVLLNDGAVMTWGMNDFGQLGTGDNENHFEPVPVKELSDVQSIALGSNHCFALLENGRVMAWGDNHYGQLGIGSTDNQNEPVKIEDLKKVKGIFSGSYHSMAVTEDGKVYSWGRNDQGQLGVLGSHRKPYEIEYLANKGITDIAMGYYHSCFINENGSMYACGWNYYGQLGIGSVKNIRKSTSPLIIIDMGLPEKTE
jgi:hypothetical protein